MQKHDIKHDPVTVRTLQTSCLLCTGELAELNHSLPRGSLAEGLPASFRDRAGNVVPQMGPADAAEPGSWDRITTS